jgi:hypothetical protein
VTVYGTHGREVMGKIKEYTREIIVGFISLLVGLTIMWFSTGNIHIQAAHAMEKQAEKVPVLEQKVDAFQTWIQGAIVKDSIQSIYWQNKLQQDSRQDEMILALYKYMKIYTPEMAKIKVPEKIQ